MDDVRPVTAQFNSQGDGGSAPPFLGDDDSYNLVSPTLNTQTQSLGQNYNDPFSAVTGRQLDINLPSGMDGVVRPQLPVVVQDLDQPMQSVASSSHSAGNLVREIDTDKVFPNPFQPRKFFDPQGLQELSDSIREHGVIQPIVVTEVPGGYELVVGERRFRASVLAGIKTVPALVKSGLGDQAKLEVALIENIQRHKLNPVEEARGYERLIKSFGLTQDQVAKKLGKSRPTITNTLRLLQLPAEIQRAIMDGRISEGHARPLISIADRSQQLALFNEILERGLNARQIEAKARELSVRRTVDGVAPDPKLMAAESELRGTLGTQVRIQRQGKGGKIMIEFFSDEELEDILNRMKSTQSGEVPNTEPYFTV